MFPVLKMKKKKILPIVTLMGNNPTNLTENDTSVFSAKTEIHAKFAFHRFSFTVWKNGWIISFCTVRRKG